MRLKLYLASSMRYETPIQTPHRRCTSTHRHLSVTPSRNGTRSWLPLGLLAATLAGGIAQAATPTGWTRVPLGDANILQIQSAFDAGSLSSEQLVRMYIRRIEAYDTNGPALTAIRHLNAKAVDAARELDKERREKGPRSPLHGIPIVLKDNHDTYDMPTTGGSKSLEGSTPLYDAFVVRQLREAGAVLLAKTNLDEFNSGSSGTSGFGQVKNPYNLDKSPGGSSGGSGAAVAAAFAQVGLGTETGSSIRNPSTKNNLVGVAPTMGLVSRNGVLPSSILLDRTGPMARNVTDAAIVLHYMAGMDAGDLFTLECVGKVPPEGYTPHLNTNALRAARIGVLRENFGSDPEDAEALTLINASLRSIAAQGATLVDPLPVGIHFFRTLADISSGGGERKEAMNLYLTRRNDTPMKSITDIASSGKALGKLQSGLEKADKAPPLHYNPDYIRFLRNRENFRELISKLFEEYDLDAIVYPYQTKPEYTLAEAAPQGGAVTGAPNYNVLGRGTRISTVTGFPGVTMPAGFTGSDGMPVGLEFLGKPFSEGPLLGLCHAFEQATKHRAMPKSTPLFEDDFILVPTH